MSEAARARRQPVPVHASLLAIQHGARGVFLDPAALVKLSQQSKPGEKEEKEEKEDADVCSRARLVAAQAEVVLRQVSTLAERPIEMFMIGKSSVLRKKTRSAIDRTKPSSWDATHIKERWASLYGPEGYDGLVPLVCVLRDDACADASASAAMNQQEYARVLEGIVMALFAERCPPGIGRCWNALNCPGSSTARLDAGGIVYVAFGFVKPEDTPRPLPTHMQRVARRPVGYVVAQRTSTSVSFPTAQNAAEKTEEEEEAVATSMTTETVGKCTLGHLQRIASNLESLALDTGVFERAELDLILEAARVECSAASAVNPSFGIGGDAFVAGWKALALGRAADLVARQKHVFLTRCAAMVEASHQSRNLEPEGNRDSPPVKRRRKTESETANQGLERFGVFCDQFRCSRPDAVL